MIYASRYRPISVGTGKGATRLAPIEVAARNMSGNPLKRLRLLSTASHFPMAYEVSELLGKPVLQAEYYQGASGLWHTKLPKGIGGSELFVVHTANQGTVNSDMMQLRSVLTAISRLPENKRPKRVVASSLHFPYARQERKAQPREHISAAAMVKLLTSVRYPVAKGIIKDTVFFVESKRVLDRIIGVNFHAPAIEGFFPIPVDHLDARSLIIDFVNSHIQDIDNTVISVRESDQLVVTGPDIGRVKMALAVAKDLFGEKAEQYSAKIIKLRGPKDESGKSELVATAFGNIEGKTVILLDDMIDTGGTIVKAVAALKRAGAKEVYVVTIHGLLSGPAVERLAGCSDIAKIGIVDTLNIPTQKLIPFGDRVEILSFAPYLAEVIKRTFQETSILGYQSYT